MATPYTNLNFALERQGVGEPEKIVSVLDEAVTAAGRSGEWRNWAFLTLQVQLAAERLPNLAPRAAMPASCAYELPEEHQSCDWAKAKEKIRDRIGEVPFANWFERTRQLERRDGHITVAVPDEPSRVFIEDEYGNFTKSVLAIFGIEEIALTVRKDLTTRESGYDTIR